MLSFNDRFTYSRLYRLIASPFYFAIVHQNRTAYKHWILFAEITMPLPNYGYQNQEKKTHQDLVFEMAPEIVSDDENSLVNGKKVKSLRGKVSL